MFFEKLLIVFQSLMNIVNGLPFPFPRGRLMPDALQLGSSASCTHWTDLQLC